MSENKLKCFETVTADIFSALYCVCEPQQTTLILQLNNHISLQILIKIEVQPASGH